MTAGTGPAWRDLVDEALGGIVARPARLALTTLGTVLGVAALVATLGLAETAAGQIATRFDAVTATHVVVVPRGAGSGNPTAEQPLTSLPWDAAERASRLAGVVAAGTYTRIETNGAKVTTVPVIDPLSATAHDLPVVATSPELLDAVRGQVTTGRYFDAGHHRRADPVAVVGAHAAERLHITGIDTQPVLFVGDHALTVIGIIDDVARRTELLDAVIIPDGTAAATFGTTAPSELHIATELGAAPLVGHQAPIVLDPNRPESLQARVPPTPSQLRQSIETDVNALFLVLGAVALLVGGLGIVNVTLLSVFERIGEIGLRRAVGATRFHIAVQFLLEGVTIGLLGGLIGTATGVLTTVVTSVLRDWTPILDLRLAAAAPALGALIGLLAGVYPAWKAAAIEPITALRGSA